MDSCTGDPEHTWKEGLSELPKAATGSEFAPLREMVTLLPVALLHLESYLFIAPGSFKL